MGDVDRRNGIRPVHFRRPRGRSSPGHHEHPRLATHDVDGLWLPHGKDVSPSRSQVQLQHEKRRTGRSVREYPRILSGAGVSEGQRREIVVGRTFTLSRHSFDRASPTALRRGNDPAVDRSATLSCALRVRESCLRRRLTTALAAQPRPLPHGTQDLQGEDALRGGRVDRVAQRPESGRTALETRSRPALPRRLSA